MKNLIEAESFNINKAELNKKYINSVKELKKDQELLGKQKQLIDIKLEELIKKNGR